MPASGDRDERLRAVVREQRGLATEPSEIPRGSEARIQRQRARRRREELRDATYHQARILLLVDTVAGKSGKLDGLTKLAKLDFLLRYPSLLEELLEKTDRNDALAPELGPTADERRAVESRMIRYKYGPWDDRYYGIIGALVGRGLLEYAEPSGTAKLALRPTAAGRSVAASLRRDDAWALTAARCEALRRIFGRTSGSRLKDEIYNHLPTAVDVAQRTEIR